MENTLQNAVKFFKEHTKDDDEFCMEIMMGLYADKIMSSKALEGNNDKILKEILEYIEANKHSFANDFELEKMRKFIKQQLIEH